MRAMLGFQLGSSFVAQRAGAGLREVGCPTSCRRPNARAKGACRMMVDPWTVSPAVVDQAAAQFFALSLVPYLGFLYHLGREETKCPPLALNGFKFLLVFVFATIPAGIYAKVHYGHILADVDWLHGTAESLLTITNLLIVLGFRSAIPTSEKSESVSASPPLAGVLAAVLGGTLLAVGHPEPWNALSIPTWVIHVSSLIEWLVAMRLVWDYAAVTGNSAWRGLTWGMLPLHTSGLCACTYHLLYNSPSVNWLVALQALLTLVGNSTMWAAAYRISRQAGDAGAGAVRAAGSTEGAAAETETGQESTTALLGRLLAISVAGSVAVKYGSLLVDFPFSPTPAVALGLVLVPTAANVAKWVQRAS